MTGSNTLKILGAALFLYGVASVAMAVYAYNVSHEAFGNVRSFATLLKTERDKVADALKGVAGVLGGAEGAQEGRAGGPISSLLPGGGRSEGGSSNPGGSGGSGGPRVADAIRGLFEGGRATPTPAAAATPQPAPPPAPAQEASGGPLARLRSDLQQHLDQLGLGWARLGEGPLAGGLLDRVELVTNVVLAWMGAHGLASVIIGLSWLFRSPAPTVLAAPPYYGSPGPYGQPYPPQYPGPYPPAAPGAYGGSPPTAPGGYPHPPDNPPPAPPYPR